MLAVRVERSGARGVGVHMSSRRYNDGLPVALAIHLGTYCAVAACFAFGVYEFMQPTRIPNPGLAGYKPPPGIVAAYIPSFVSKFEFAATAASPGDGTLETDGVNAPSPTQSKPA